MTHDVTPSISCFTPCECERLWHTLKVQQISSSITRKRLSVSEEYAFTCVGTNSWGLKVGWQISDLRKTRWFAAYLGGTRSVAGKRLFLLNRMKQSKSALELIDLSFLSAEEEAAIRQVLLRDEDLKRLESGRVR